MTLILSAGLAELSYITATSVLVARLWSSATVHRRLVLIPAALAIAFHTLLFIQATYAQHVFNLNLYNSLSLVTLIVVAMLLLGSLLRPLENLGVVLFPIALATVGLQAMFGRELQVVVDYAWQLQMHVALSIFAFAILSIASAQAVLLAMQERALRRSRLTGPLESLPALQTMETILFQLIGIGFALLTLALVSGVVFIDDLLAQRLAHKTVLSVTAWLVFGTLLWGRWQFGWRGRTAIRMTLAGMGVLLLAYFGSKLVIELILHDA